ncbi:MAG TPA: MarR family winged helix-turn-helix transcriptional regulator [Candidatus Stackebrandtia excrementipullorum]|nr:MarR family winged helix-turn-helix transcriptional regulator [Candidatus Stackebrandtia excrementipullorum]
MTESPSSCDEQENAAPVGHALFRVARAHRMAAGTLLRELGLYPGQEIMLAHLATHGDQRQSALVLALSIDPSTVTKMLHRLAKAGLVARRPCPDDGRVSLVSITESGRALIDRITESWRRLEARTTRGLSKEQQAQLTTLLSLLERNLGRLPGTVQYKQEQDQGREQQSGRQGGGDLQLRVRAVALNLAGLAVDENLPGFTGEQVAAHPHRQQHQLVGDVAVRGVHPFDPLLVPTDVGATVFFDDRSHFRLRHRQTRLGLEVVAQRVVPRQVCRLERLGVVEGPRLQLGQLVLRQVARPHDEHVVEGAADGTAGRPPPRLADLSGPSLRFSVDRRGVGLGNVVVVAALTPVPRPGPCIVCPMRHICAFGRLGFGHLLQLVRCEPTRLDPGLQGASGSRTVQREREDRLGRDLMVVGGVHNERCRTELTLL